MNFSLLTLVLVSCVALSYGQDKYLLVGQTSGDIQIQTANQNYGLVAQVIKAHGCDTANNCWVTYINQLSSKYSNWVVTSGDDSLIKIWEVRIADPDDGEYLRHKCTLTGHTNWVYKTIEVSSVSDRLASASKDGTVRLWSISQCSLIDTFQVGVETRALENYPTGAAIISGDVLGQIIQWDLNTGTSTLLATLPSKINDLYLLGSTNQNLAAASSNNCGGNCGAVSFYDKGSLWVFDSGVSGFNYSDANTYSSVYFIYGDTAVPDSDGLDFQTDDPIAHQESVRVIDPLNDINDLIATSSSDFTTRVWSFSTRDLVNKYAYHTGDIRYSLDHIAFPNKLNSYLLVDGSFDTNVNAYTIPSGTAYLAGAYSTGQQVSSLRIVNESNGRLKAFVGLMSLAFTFTRLF